MECKLDSGTSQKMKVLFLDIDGVMISCPSGKNYADQFCPEPVRALREVFYRHPDLSIVFSTDRRLTPIGISGLSRMWEQAGFSHRHAYSSTPELPLVPYYSRRSKEIQKWMREHPHFTHWVVVDDTEVTMPHQSRVIRTSPSIGLTWDHAIEISALLRHPSQINL